MVIPTIHATRVIYGNYGLESRYLVPNVLRRVTS
jgi:hypothetical protein